MISKPKNINTESYYESYIGKVPESDLANAFINSEKATVSLFNSVPQGKEDFAYAEGKWTVKQLFQHLIDCERILCYRALTMARNDQTNLAGFDENLYVDNDYSSERSLAEISDEFSLVRKGTIALFESFNTEALDFEGLANDVKMTPRIIGWFLVGHNIHHINVLKERYL